MKEYYKQCPYASIDLLCGWGNLTGYCERCSWYTEPEENTIMFTSTACTHEFGGVFRYVQFWIFKKKFLVCEACLDLVPKGKWKIF